MRTAATFVFPFLVSITLWAGALPPPYPQSPETSVAVYDDSPSHIWNRLYAALRVREDPQGNKHGVDSLDLMLWQNSDYLLTQPSHERALRVLDEFLQTHAEMLIQSPLKRAMLQRDLWAVFDWTVQQYPETEYGDQKRALQIRLAEVLKRLALPQEQIKSLPDNYAQAVASGAFAAKFDPSRPQQPFLPPDLFDPRGPWVCITPSPESIGSGGVAKSHFVNLSGRSVFLVFVRLPEGRQATLDYFQTLWNFPQPWVPGPQPVAADQSLPNPDLPSFPAGTQVALARQMVLFDNQGNLVVSPITESLQIRVYREITAAQEHDFSGGPTTRPRNSGQEFFEIKMSRALLFTGKQGGLRATAPDERELPTFQTMGFDLVNAQKPDARPAPVLQTCLTCHSGGGMVSGHFGITTIMSFNSLGSLLKPTRRQQEPRDINYGPRFWSESHALAWKKNHYDWGLLNGYWKATS